MFKVKKTFVIEENNIDEAETNDTIIVRSHAEYLDYCEIEQGHDMLVLKMEQIKLLIEALQQFVEKELDINSQLCYSWLESEGNMTLENKGQLKKAVFNILKYVYDIRGDAPKSEKQEQFVENITNYVYDTMKAREVGPLPIPYADKFQQQNDDAINEVIKVIEGKASSEVKKGRGRPKGAKNK